MNTKIKEKDMDTINIYEKGSRADTIYINSRSFFYEGKQLKNKYKLITKRAMYTPKGYKQKTFGYADFFSDRKEAIEFVKKIARRR